MKTKEKYFAVIIALSLFVMKFSDSKSQCTWHQLLFDSFEYTTPCPDVIPGITYTSIPQSYSVHSGTYSLYLNFIDCVGSTGACPGDTAYIRHVPVCPGIPTRISTWFTTTFSGLQCDIQVKIIDTANIVLSSTASLLAPYSPSWTHYQSPIVYPITSTLSFVIITNVGGGNGNDLSMDDFLLENCWDLPLGPDTVLCKNDILGITPGSGYASYLWNDSTTNPVLVATYGGAGADTSQYYVTVINSDGCVFASDTQQVIFVNCGTINFSSSDTSFCEKQCLNFYDLSTNNPTSWQWLFPGATPDTSSDQNPSNICYNNYGHFDVTLIACNSVYCDTIIIPGFINEYPGPTDSIYVLNDTLWSLPFTSYQWYEQTAGLIPGATSQYFIASVAGTYYCIVSDSIGCITASNVIVATGVFNSSSLSSGILISPNPNNGDFEINFVPRHTEHATLKIIDALGRVVFHTMLSRGQSSLQLHSLPLSDGIYFVEMEGGKNMLRQKIVVNR